MSPSRYNAAIFTTQPSSRATVLVATPEFLNNGPVNIAITTETVLSRVNKTLPGLPQKGPKTISPSQLGSRFGRTSDGKEDPTTQFWGIDVAETCGPDGCIQYQDMVNNGTINKYLSAVDCLDTYLSAFSNASDAILISTTDLLEPERTLPTDNSLLYIDLKGGIQSPGCYWECGPTNTFDCRNPAAWGENTSIVQDWNVFGYKIDYCLVSERNLQSFCGLNFSVPIMIGNCVRTPHVYWSC
jgi:hypothetical protein